DGTSNIVGLVGMSLAARPADRDHPYGHYKYETYASAGIAAMLVFAAYRIGSTTIEQLTTAALPTRVNAIAFGVMIVTLGVNLFITTWERRVGKRLGSEVLIADASHTASDVLVSVGVMISLAIVWIGEATGHPEFAKADPIVALLVAVAIIYTAWGVFKQASATLSDTARIDPKDICSAVMATKGVLGCHHVRTRGSAAEVYVDLHVQVDESRTVSDGHRIAEDVERMLVEEFPQVVDAIVHLEPYDEYQVEKTAKESDAGLA
ncbi:MAG TPA: cation diffusion facilitator family transporter, partial [Coriobacteriia bacterium]|nr:cation diffusion facilitator family transporter [Coriobacteriia bacterium]